MGGYNSGGHNRTHGTVGQYKKLDSFFYREFLGFLEYKGLESIKLGGFAFHGNYIENADGLILLVGVPNNYGGQDRLYFECPYCYRRARFLYWHDGWVKCRTCARLNYRSQQETKSNGDLSAYKMQQLLKKLKVTEDLCTFDAARYRPERPRYMHEKTYRRLLVQLYREQDNFYNCSMAMLARIQNIVDTL